MHKDQFTATGPANAGSGHSRTAFSNNTQSNQGDDDFTYGVNVQGSLCGVYGESLQNGRGSARQATEDNVGVWGAGESFGVMGEALGDKRGIAGVCGSNNGSNNGVLGLAVSKGAGVIGLSLKDTEPKKIEKIRTITSEFEADGDSIGVLGASGTGIGVVGTSGRTGVRGDSHDGIGVVGSSVTGTGVEGGSNIGIGVAGGSVTNSGVFGSSIEGDGVSGSSTRGTGVSASSQNTTGLSASSERGDAVVAQAKRASGVIAVSGGSGNGVVAFSEGGDAVLAAIPRPTGNVTTTGGRGRFAGRFIGPVLVEGSHHVLLDQIVYRNLVVLGRKSAAAPHPDGSHRLLYSIESPESWFEDFGEGKLTTGRADVTLDPDFAAVIKTGKYHVFVTPYGKSNGLYVTHRSSKGFRVQEQNGGNSNVRFSYRVVAKRKDIKAGRMARITLPDRPESESPKLLKRLKSLTGKRQSTKDRKSRGSALI